jgi:glycosyltransferase involved in cell wall biosynthesis
LLTAPKERAGERGTPRVSIVLPVFNSAKELPAALSELEKQSFDDREIIIVDDGSSDGTWDVAESLSRGRDYIILLRTEHLGPSHARNAGMQRARGEIVFFSESDCTYDPTYLQKAVDALDSKKGAAGVCLTGAPLITRATMATNCLDIENKVQHRLLDQGKIEPFYAWVFRRDVLQKLGGYDERLFQGEDRDLFQRLKDNKYDIAWVPGVNWRHIRGQTTPELAIKWISRGRTRVLYLLKHRRVLDLAKSLVTFWATVFGFVILPFSPLIGAIVLVLVAAAFLGRTLRVMSVSWPLVQRKRSYVGYPLFIMIRNFTTAMGYSLAMIVIAIRKLQGKEIAWNTI